MPNSLRNKIKHLAYKGELNEREKDRILNALDREGQAHLVGFENPNYSPFDNSPRILMTCSNCGNAVLSVYRYCPMCGMEFNQPPKMMCEED